MDMDIEKWEDVANDRSRWRRDLHGGQKRGEEKRRSVAGKKRARGKGSNKSTSGKSVFTCICYNRDYHSGVNL